MPRHPALLFVALALGLGGLTPAAAQVVVREETISIPTWEIGPPAVHPLFPGPQGAIYPYTLNDTLLDRKRDRSYRAVFLENEYVQVLVLPELGGRVHGARDKTNGYRWLYWQPTIKPGLISMTGAWISGGIEWNFPHGHRPSGFMPVDHRVVRQADGSVTVWVGETEPVYRMRWLVGITLAPGRSSFSCDYVFVNPTDARHPFQFWATAATHANEWSQAQYPGDVVTGHGKEEFWHWPVEGGVDQSWWKNVKNASSFFAWQSQDDWFGAYDHKAEGGLVHVADHRVMPGKKLWTWGAGPSGRIWEDILTEGGGPYFEPQAGAFSDNQPDYHWMAPGQVRRAHDAWYPVRGIRGFRKATEDFALNVDVSDGKAFAGVYATSARDGVSVTLEDARDGKRLVEQLVHVAPDRPFSAEVPAPQGLTLHDLRLRVRDATGRIALELVPPRQRDAALPPPAKPPGPPAELKPDELYAAGDWLDRFRRRPEALAYYAEALRRDPDDARVRVALGGIALDETRWTDALSDFERALARDADDGRAHFGRGVALLSIGRATEAEEAFAKASLAAETFAVAERALARLAFARGDARAALARLRAAESSNAALADLPALARHGPSPAGRARVGARVGRAGARARSDALHGRPREEARARGPRPADGRMGGRLARVHARLGAEPARAGGGLPGVGACGRCRGRAERRRGARAGRGGSRPLFGAAGEPAGRLPAREPGAAARRRERRPRRIRARGRAAARVREPAPCRRGDGTRERRSARIPGTLTPSTCWATRSTASGVAKTASRAGARPRGSTPRSRSPGATSAMPSASCARTSVPRPRRIARPSRPTPATRASCSSSTRPRSVCSCRRASDSPGSTPTARSWTVATISWRASST